MDEWYVFIALFVTYGSLFILGYIQCRMDQHRRIQRMLQRVRPGGGSHERNMGYLEAIGDFMLTRQEYRAKEVGERLSQVGIKQSIV